MQVFSLSIGQDHFVERTTQETSRVGEEEGGGGGVGLATTVESFRERCNLTR